MASSIGCLVGFGQGSDRRPKTQPVQISGWTSKITGAGKRPLRVGLAAFIDGTSHKDLRFAGIYRLLRSLPHSNGPETVF